jgi:peptidoglycan hydrolase CwlO-like protein
VNTAESGQGHADTELQVAAETIEKLRRENEQLLSTKLNLDEQLLLARQSLHARETEIVDRDRAAAHNQAELDEARAELGNWATQLKELEKHVQSTHSRHENSFAEIEQSIAELVNDCRALNSASDEKPTRH